MRVLLPFALLAVCHGLGVQRQPSATTDGGSQLGQTGRVMSRDSLGLGDVDVGKSEQTAILARMAAEQAEKESYQELGSNISERELNAKYHHAEIEANTEFGRHEKMEDAVTSMDHSAGMEDRVVGGLLREGAVGKSHVDRKLANLERRFDKLERKELAAANKEEEMSVRESKKSFHDIEQQAAHDKAVAAREMKVLEKQIAAARVQKKTDKKSREEAERETSVRLMEEADDLRKAADDGTLSKDEIMRLLDVTPQTLNHLMDKLVEVSTKDDRGDWFEDRVEGLRSKSAESSAHLVETIAYKAKEFVEHQNGSTGYSDHQFLGMLAKLLNDTKSEIGVLHKESDAISDRVQGFQQNNPETFTSALTLALDGVMRNIEFRNNLIKFDTRSLANSSMAEACGLLSSMLASHMQPAYQMIARQKQSLDNIAKVVPSMVKLNKDVGKMLDNRTHNLLNMAYMEHLAYRDCANVLMTEVTWVVLQHLQCSFSSAFVHAGLSHVAAVLAAFASWFAY